MFMNIAQTADEHPPILVQHDFEKLVQHDFEKQRAGARPYETPMTVLNMSAPA
jgi:hypothetical protein